MRRRVDLVTTESPVVGVLVPQGTTLAPCGVFFVWPPANHPALRTRLEGSMPADVVGGASATTTVYRAQCEPSASCADLLVAQPVTVCAEKSIQRSGFIAMTQLSSLPFGARRPACGAGG